MQLRARPLVIGPQLRKRKACRRGPSSRRRAGAVLVAVYIKTMIIRFPHRKK